MNIIETFICCWFSLPLSSWMEKCGAVRVKDMRLDYIHWTSLLKASSFGDQVSGININPVSCRYKDTWTVQGLIISFPSGFKFHQRSITRQARLAQVWPDFGKLPRCASSLQSATQKKLSQMNLTKTSNYFNVDEKLFVPNQLPAWQSWWRKQQKIFPLERNANFSPVCGKKTAHLSHTGRQCNPLHTYRWNCQRLVHTTRCWGTACLCIRQCL